MDEIGVFLSNNFHQPHTNKNIYTSYEEIELCGITRDEEMVFDGFDVNLNITHSHKDYCNVKIYYHGQELPEGQIGKKQGNCKIELYLPSWCSWDTFFEGFVPDLVTLKTIFNCIGIPYAD